jgi:hypothetical protein
MELVLAHRGKMVFNIISNIVNGVGLEQDYRLLRVELERLGHTVAGVQYTHSTGSISGADVNIFLELINPHLFTLAKQQWFIPNPEWFFQREYLHKFDKILAKTKDTQRIFTQLGSDKVSFLGWKSRDLYMPALEKDRRFLHISGKSQFKNTQAVIDCWTKYTPQVPLVIVGQHYQPIGIPNIQHFFRLDDGALKTLMSSCQFHLLPSAYEGFGHALHEAFGVKAVVITTDASPMNEVPAPILVASTSQKPYNFGMLKLVTPEDVYCAVNKALSLTNEECTVIGEQARQFFDQEVQKFSYNLEELCKSTS